MRKPLISIPLGIGVGILGKLTNKEHLKILAHYFLGTGKDYKLSQKFEKEINYLFECGNNHALPGSDREILMANSDELYYSVGKFYLYKENDKLIVEDQYIFYPWCGKLSHFKDCDCKEKTWNVINIGNFNPSKFIIEYIGGFIRINGKTLLGKGKRISTHIKWFFPFYLEVTDNVFSWFGKEFRIVGKYNIDYVENYRERKENPIKKFEKFCKLYLNLRSN
jgi:hypothetical protein